MEQPRPDATRTPPARPRVPSQPAEWLNPAPRCSRAADEDEEPLGGDPACWLHLFDEEEGEPPTAAAPAAPIDAD